MIVESVLLFFLIVNAFIIQAAPSEVAKDCPIQTVDESFSHTFSDVHLEGLKTSADNEIGILNASLLQPATNEAAKDCPIQIVDESLSHTFSDVHLEGLKTNTDIEIGVLNASLLQPPINEEMGESCPIQTMDESFFHTLGDIHLEELQSNADSEIGVLNASLLQPPTNEAMGESFQPTEEVQISSGIASTASPNMSKKSVLTIVLDLNGLLLKHFQQQPSSIYESIQMDSKGYIVLRPGCIQFLKIILERFNVGIWSTTTESNVLLILRILQDRAGEILPFFVVWAPTNEAMAYDKCESYKLVRPDNPTVEAMFKPLSKISTCFDCDARRTVLIDDSPYKGCASPDNNCIFPTTFDEKSMIDNILMDELLPYLLRLDESEDVRKVIGSQRYGQPPISNENEFEGVAKFWKERNLNWSQKTINTDRLPLAEQIQKLVDNQEVSTREYENKRKQIKEIMEKERVSIARMNGPAMISLARKLGCTTTQLKLTNAKAFINKLLKEYKLLQWARNR